MLWLLIRYYSADETHYLGTIFHEHQAPRGNVHSTSTHSFYSIPYLYCNSPHFSYLFIFIVFMNFQHSFACTSFPWYLDFCIKAKEKKKQKIWRIFFILFFFFFTRRKSAKKKLLSTFQWYHFLQWRYAFHPAALKFFPFTFRHSIILIFNKVSIEYIWSCT